MSREEGLKKRCQKIRMRRERDVNEKRLKNHPFQETAMTLEKHASGLGFHSCQQEGLSEFRDDKGKPDQEEVALQKRMPRERHVKDEFQKIMQTTAVTTGRPPFLLIGSPFSL